MTRKDYEFVAGTIYETLYSAPVDHEPSILRELAERFADRFAADNPRFDRTRFMGACGFKE